MESPHALPTGAPDACPLVVDLDGTLVLTDTLHESAVALGRQHPWRTLQIPAWLAQGKAQLKRRLAKLVTLDAATLPYNQPLLEWLRQQRAAGRKLVLCSATDQQTAQAVADHLGLFDQVIASDGHINMAADTKAGQLAGLFGEHGFDYAGNSSADIPVWRRARHAIVVNARPALLRQAQGFGNVTLVFPPETVTWRDIRQMLRVHQWSKNSLLLVPLLAAHLWNDATSWWTTLLAILAFSLCASAVYIANDLLDLDSDRRHPRKMRRPFASGRIPIWVGVMLAPLLLATSYVLALPAPTAFLHWLTVYFLLTCLYSLYLKRLVLLDCLALALLYSLRIIAGAAAAGIPLSHWLLAFSGFLFLSLAFLKRYVELRAPEDTLAHGRGYVTTDAPLIQSLGVAAGYATAVVLALYLHSDVVLQLYRLPEAIWLAVPVVVFWVSWMWLRAHRGEMHDDPVLFAMQDRVSLLAGASFVAVLMLGSLGLP